MGKPLMIQVADEEKIEARLASSESERVSREFQKNSRLKKRS
jgi:hypothetical protein